MNLPSITELPNELTNDLDIVGAEGIARLLRQSDAQIFNGWREYVGLYDETILRTLERLIAVVGEALKTPERTAIVMSGAGTSGRLAFFVAREFNKVMRERGQHPCFHYLMAGGDKALIRAQEGAEDDPVAAIHDLKRYEAEGRTIIYIGITCGCSAPYIAAQLDYTMTRPNYVSVLLGFNPVARARRVPVEGWDKTFHDVMSTLAGYDDDRHFILNPIIGPEAVTGSTRLKGGTATKLLLELVFGMAISNLTFMESVKNIPKSNSAEEIKDLQKFIYEDILSQIRDHIVQYTTQWEEIHRRTYLTIPQLAPLIEVAGDTLRREGHIYYIGFDTLGILGLVDASECPPTFGAGFSDVRGFVVGGWDTMQNNEGDLSHEGVLYQISVDDFRRNLLHNVTEDDLIIFLRHGSDDAEEMLTIAEAAQRAKARMACVTLNIKDWQETFQPWNFDKSEEELLEELEEEAVEPRSPHRKFSVMVAADGDAEEIVMEKPNPFEPYCKWLVNIGEHYEKSGMKGLHLSSELACKWMLNAITTGAHILKGKVYQNRMIDLRISNNKLYYRTIGIIRQLMGVDEETARLCLLRSVYGTDTLSEEHLNAPISRHVEVGTAAHKIVPTALLLATGQFTVASAHEALATDPIVRNIIKNYVTS